MALSKHQYIERHSAEIREEHLLADHVVRRLYSDVMEKNQRLFRVLTGGRVSSLLGFLNYDTVIGARLRSGRKALEAWGADPAECLVDPDGMQTAREVFERKIRYWECRPMEAQTGAVLSPADSKMLLGSFERSSMLFIKDKFFEFNELLGDDKTRWLRAFKDGDFAVFRLTPDKYHYNHTPVAGRVVDFYHLEGSYHSCNPSAVVASITPYSKNKRAVTVIDTDVPGGDWAGLVAMIEVAALMVGDIVQCYCRAFYENPEAVMPGLFVKKGLPKSLFRPGGSTVVLIFQPNRVRFDQDLVENQRRQGVESRFSQGFGQPLVETEVEVRSRIGAAGEPARFI